MAAKPALSAAPTRLGAVPRLAIAEPGKPSAGWYGSRWRRAARLFLNRNPLCLGCHARGLVRAASLVDHVVPHRGDRVRFWDVANWQALCRDCHDGLKQRLEKRYDNGALGPADLRLDSPAALRL